MRHCCVGEVGDALIVPDVALWLYDPSLQQQAERCMLSLFHKHNNKQINEWMREGSEALKLQQYHEASKLFEWVVATDPFFAEVSHIHTTYGMHNLMMQIWITQTDIKTEASSA